MCQLIANNLRFKEEDKWFWIINKRINEQFIIRKIKILKWTDKNQWKDIIYEKYIELIVNGVKEEWIID